MILPLTKPRPDAASFIAVLGGRLTLSRPPLFEYLVDESIMRSVVVDMLGRTWVPPGGATREAVAAYLDNYIAFWYHLGYDTLRFPLGMRFPGSHVSAPDTADVAQRQRHWADEHTRIVASWDDFERIHWPSVQEVDFWPIEYLGTHLPDGMALMVEHSCHICELVTAAFTYEGMSLALYDQPDLFQAVTDKIGQSLVDYYRLAVGLPNVVAVLTGDDMGFRSGTFLKPDDMRRYFLPWHARISAVAHEAGKRRYLHSCGNLAAIMDDLIEVAHIDGKHSFEDAIQPVEEFHRLYHRRIATLGGVDVDILARGGEDDVRQRTRQIIDSCAPLGRFAIGSGNSIPSYVSLRNYLAMVEEALR